LVAAIVAAFGPCFDRLREEHLMSSRHVSAFAFLILTVVASIATAGPFGDPNQFLLPTLSVKIDDGETQSIPVAWVPDSGRKSGGIFLIGGSEQGFEYSDGENMVSLAGGLDPDPVMAFGGAVFDFGAPSTFSFTFIMPLAPIFPNPSFVFDSFSGSVVNGPAAGDVTVTALAPPLGFPVDPDGDGDLEIQVYSLSDDGGSTWKNVGLDAGPTMVFPLGASNADVYPTINQGFIPTTLGGPWTHMRADINFGLSGGGDIFTFSGRKVLVPEPGTLGVLALSFIFGAWIRRR
jgi:hypothetical protein